MNKEELYDAITHIDEELLDLSQNESCGSTFKMDTVNNMSKKSSLKKIWIPMAACIAVVLGVGLGIAKSGWFSRVPSPSAEINTTSEEESDNVVYPNTEERKTSVDKENNKTETTKFSSAVNDNTSTSIQITTNHKQDSQSNSNGNKGGDTSERVQNQRIGTDGNSYKVFKPGVDKFEPLDEMTLENRFCSFVYNGLSYYPVLNGEITKDDYEPNKLASVKAENWELRTANADDETSGIVYYARIDIYKLKDVDPNEAVACVISFNGETKEYKYNAAEIINPS